MDKFENSLEQLKAVENSSQGEEVSQIDNGVEEVSDVLGSKSENGTQGSFVEDKNDDERQALSSKFKSVRELSKAYDNLQSDYTKKCQALAFFQKQIKDNKVDALPNSQNFFENFDSFLKENPNAEEFKNEIFDLVLKNKDYTQNAINDAWSSVKSKNFKTKKELINDDEFLNSYVYNNEKIKEKIVKDYFSSINFVPSPKLISGKISQPIVTVASKPKSLTEATKLVEDIFS